MTQPRESTSDQLEKCGCTVAILYAGFMHDACNQKARGVSKKVPFVSFCLMTDLEEGTVTERSDRLPLKRARTEFEQRRDERPFEFMRHVIESWLFAQHTYWSIGRGLADARARGKTILRLKVVLEDGGWTLTPGVARGSFPLPTADRLRTALSLAHECGLIDQVET